MSSSSDLNASFLSKLNPRKSIFLRSILIITAIVTAVVVVNSIMLLRKSSERELDQISNTAQMIVELQSSALVGPMWDLDSDAIDKLLADLSRHPSFQAAWILDGNQSEVAIYGEKKEDDTGFVVSAKIVQTADGQNEDLGTLFFELSYDELNAYQQSQTIYNIIAALILLAVILAGVVFCFRLILKPMNLIGEVMLRLADSELDVEIPAKDRADEIGKMARTVEVFRDNAQRMRRLEREKATQEQKMQEQKKEETRRMANSFREKIGAAIDKISVSASDMQGTASKLNDLVTQSKAQVEDGFNASDAMSENIQAVASAADQLTASISEISEQASLSSRQASAGLDQVSKSSQQIEALVSSAQHIEEIVGM
ncbi:MAG: methyl-accepting chemotaxis protein, partial [Alphaproteobacteria bacterium]|nr:methyl-accepting chemotaxis protein [Alphaproteobacteria bacterium]